MLSLLHFCFFLLRGAFNIELGARAEQFETEVWFDFNLHQFLYSIHYLLFVAYVTIKIRASQDAKRIFEFYNHSEKVEV